MVTIRVVVISDASLAETKSLKKQLGYLVLTADAKRTANIVHNDSKRCRRDLRPAMAVEVYPLVHASDISYVVTNTLQNQLGRDIDLEA